MPSSAIFKIFLMSATFSSAFSAVVPRMLSPDELIIWNSAGQTEVVNRTEYFAKNALPVLEPINSTKLNGTAAPQTVSGPISKRCDEKEIVTYNPDQYFLNWDVAMSSVVKGASTVAVTEGYTIANSLAVSSSIKYSIIESILDVSLSLTYTNTWTSSYAAAYTFSVPADKYGVVVSNPSTRRVSGTLDSGCVGSMTRTTFTGDSYSSKAYGGLSWVDGVIGLCTSDTYPVPMCVGGGVIA